MSVCVAVGTARRQCDRSGRLSGLGPTGGAREQESPSRVPNEVVMPQTLYLIDAFAQIFRAYYSIRGGMSSPRTHEPTQAVFGFTGMLLKLLTQLKPDYVVVATDTPGKTFRDELFADYKATRSPAPDDLIVQIPRVMELIKLFGIPLVGAPELEADDVIATIVTRVISDPAYKDVNVRIVSKDKDLEQLLGERVEMYDIHTDITVDEAALLANKGVSPAQVIDLLALTGDSVDNVPGVDGIGPKTAALLIHQYGSIEGIFAHIDEIKGKRREALEAARGHLPLSRELVTLRTDSDFAFDLEQARVSALNLERIVPFFQELGFNRYQEEVRKITAPATPAPEPALSLFDLPAPTREPITASYCAVTTAEDLRAVCEAIRKAPIVAVDTETTGLEKDAKLCGVSLSWEEGSGVYVPTLSPQAQSHLSASEALAILGPVLEDASVAKCGHNLKFDARVLLADGVALRGVVFDLFLASSLIDPAQPAHKLDHLASTLLGYTMIPITELIGDNRTMADADLGKTVDYAAEDADIALRLYYLLSPKLAELGMDTLMRTCEAPLTAVLAQMEMNGIIVDPEELARHGKALAVRVEELRAQFLRRPAPSFLWIRPASSRRFSSTLWASPPARRSRRGARPTSTNWSGWRRLRMSATRARAFRD